MKRLIVAGSILILLSVGMFAQGDNTSRPRVVRTPSPPVIQNEPPRDSQPQRPPVLGGGNPRTTPQPSSTPPSEDDDEGIIRVETNLVTMPVSVLDRDGRFISGLQQRDFKIFENGIEQKVDFFQSVEQPFTVVIMIDVSPSTQFKMDEIHNAAISFVDQLRPGDRVMVIAFDERMHVLTQPTSDRYILRNAIRQAQFGNGTSLYEAVDFAIDRHLRRIDGRKAVVVFTDGVDTTSRGSTFESTIRSTEEVDALFYTIRYDTENYMRRGGTFPGGPGTRRGRNPTIGDILAGIILGGTVNIGGGPAGTNSAEYAKGRQYLETISQNSGGRHFEADTMSNLTAAFAGIAEELRRQYSLGYYPENVGNIGDRKQIRVRVMRPEVVVRAKTSYIVGQSDRKFAGS